ncbi:hypothetical protein HN51_043001 [Arachis hypogaea]
MMKMPFIDLMAVAKVLECDDDEDGGGVTRTRLRKLNHGGHMEWISVKKQKSKLQVLKSVEEEALTQRHLQIQE